MANEEITAIFDSDMNQKFSTSTSMKVDVLPPARVMRHPLENGSSVTDHIVFDPVELEVIIVFKGDDMRDGYWEVMETFRAGEILTVQTKVDTYPNMVIEQAPHDETNDMIDLLTVSLRLVEAKFVQVEYTAVRKASNGPTVKRGEQPTKPKESVAYRIFH